MRLADMVCDSPTSSTIGAIIGHAPPRRFPPPWSIDESEACFIVRDGDKQALAYVYFEGKPGRRSSAKLLTRDEAQAAKRAAADLEGHTAAAKFGQPGRLSARIGRQAAPITLWYRTTEDGSPQPGSAGLGVYQAGSLRSASR
jgi:hypothetical protein